MTQVTELLLLTPKTGSSSHIRASAQACLLPAIRDSSVCPTDHAETQELPALAYASHTTREQSSRTQVHLLPGTVMIPRSLSGAQNVTHKRGYSMMDFIWMQALGPACYNTKCPCSPGASVVSKVKKATRSPLRASCQEH